MEHAFYSINEIYAKNTYRTYQIYRCEIPFDGTDSGSAFLSVDWSSKDLNLLL